MGSTPLRPILRATVVALATLSCLPSFAETWVSSLRGSGRYFDANSLRRLASQNEYTYLASSGSAGGERTYTRIYLECATKSGRLYPTIISANLTDQWRVDTSSGAEEEAAIVCDLVKNVSVASGDLAPFQSEDQAKQYFRDYVEGPEGKVKTSRLPLSSSFANQEKELKSISSAQSRQTDDVQRSESSSTTPPVDPSNRCLKALSEDSRLIPIAAKLTLGRPEAPPLETLANRAKPTQKERAAIVVFAAETEQCFALGEGWRVGNYSADINSFLATYRLDGRVILADLHAGNISFGEAVRLRAKAATEYNARIDAITAATQQRIAAERQALAAETERIAKQKLKEVGDGTPDDAACQKYGFTVGTSDYSGCRQKIELARQDGVRAQQQYELQLKQYEEQKLAYTRRQDEIKNQQLMEMGLRLLSGQSLSEVGYAAAGIAPIAPQRPRPMTQTITLPGQRMISCTTFGSNTSCF